MSWNPRYVAYAKQAGRTPEETLQDDAERFPGGKMAGFIAWISKRWAEWDRQRPAKFAPNGEYRSDEEHTEFTAWLDVAPSA